MIVNLYELSYESQTLYLNSSNHDMDLVGLGNYYAAPGQFGDVTHDLKEDTNEVEWRMPYYFTRYERAAIPIVDGILSYAANCVGLGLVTLTVRRYDFETYNPSTAVIIFSGVGDTFGMTDDMFGIKFKSIYATMSGLGSRLVCTPLCTTELYSTMCKLVKATYTYDGTITYLSDDRTRVTAGIFDAFDSTYFTYGYIVCKNEYKYIIGHDKATQSISMISPFSKNIIVTDNFIVYAGCDKTVIMCADKFNNVENFYGFPYAPLESAVYMGMRGSGQEGGGGSSG
jgi:uncharacterized phage protein (TIGR02218 family)